MAKSPNRVVLRPLAFKPVVPRKYTSPQSAYHEHGPSLDEGYSSNDCRFNDSLSTNGGGYGQIRKQMNSHSRRSSERSYSGEMGLVKAERPESHNSSNQSWISSVHGDYVQTPSPSDSGVGELEAIIRDKEAQINQIRDVMEKNERAIMQVYEDKQKEHEMDIKELQYEFEEKLKAAQQRALKMEQSLLMQNVKLQNENRELTDKLKQAQESLQISDRKCLDVERELDSCQNELEKHKWNLHQKCGELTHVKAQLKDAKDDLAVKMNESLSYKTRMKDLRDQLDEKQSDIHELDSKLHDLEEKMADRKLDLSNHNFSNCVTCCEKCNNETQTDCTSSQSELFSSRTDSPCDYGDEVLRLRTQMQRDRLDYEHDRTKWLDEKNKVICYQKQLQLNYVQMYRKNKMLEADIEQLTLDLERKDSQSLQEESVC